MKLVNSIADWLARRLVVQSGKAIDPPGGGRVFRHDTPTGSSFTVLSRGDSFDCYHEARAVYAFSLAPSALLGLAWFVIWTYWVRGTWCGIKTRLWNWSMRHREPKPLRPSSVLRIVHRAGDVADPDRVALEFQRALERNAS